jgi:hypothetical protein
MREEMKLTMAIVIALVGSAFGVTLGYSYSQTQLGKLVAVHDNRISTAEQRQRDLQAESGAHMREAIELFKAGLETQRESVAAHKRSVEAFERVSEAMVRQMEKK